MGCGQASETQSGHSFSWVELVGIAFCRHLQDTLATPVSSVITLCPRADVRRPLATCPCRRAHCTYDIWSVNQLVCLPSTRTAKYDKTCPFDSRVSTFAVPQGCWEDQGQRLGLT